MNIIHSFPTHLNFPKRGNGGGEGREVERRGAKREEYRMMLGVYVSSLPPGLYYTFNNFIWKTIFRILQYQLLQFSFSFFLKIFVIVDSIIDISHFAPLYPFHPSPYFPLTPGLHYPMHYPIAVPMVNLQFFNSPILWAYLENL